MLRFRRINNNCIGHLIKEHDFQKEAVKVGAAKFVADDNGNVKFVWLKDAENGN